MPHDDRARTLEAMLVAPSEHLVAAVTNNTTFTFGGAVGLIAEAAHPSAVTDR